MLSLNLPIKLQTHSDQVDDRKAAEVTYQCITIQHFGIRISSKNRPM